MDEWWAKNMKSEFNIHDKPSDDNARDEVINIRLPRAQYEILRKMIAREEASTWLEARLRSHWIWFIGGGLVSLFLLWDKIQALVAKV